MTNKNQRQRGTRTRGRGTHKKQRSAGNRGGRGNAGSRKHEQHNHGPWEKHGFTRPEKAQQSVSEVTVQELDENVAVYAADGLADETDDGYRLDARDVVEDGHEADVVKVLGTGQARHSLDVTADAFTDGAVERIEAAGGTVTRSERATADEEHSEE